MFFDTIRRTKVYPEASPFSPSPFSRLSGRDETSPPPPPLPPAGSALALWVPGEVIEMSSRSFSIHTPVSSLDSVRNEYTRPGPRFGQ